MGNPHYASVSRGHVFSQQVVNRVLGRDPPLERHATRTGNLEAIAVGSDVAHPGDEAGRASGGLPRSDDNKDAVIRFDSIAGVPPSVLSLTLLYNA